MRIKFLGEWYEIQCFNITKNDGTAFITKDFECDIEDIEINGRHLAPSAESDTIPAYPKGRVTEGEYDVMNVGKEDNFPTKHGEFRVGDEVMTIDFGGNIFRGTINELYGNGLCHLVSPDYKRNLIDIPTSKLVDDSADADPYYAAVQIRKKQAEYWEKRASANISNVIDWEQRRWDLACSLFSRYKGKDSRDAEEIIHFADVLIDEYRKEAKL
jgi:hypothetical protein